MSEPFLGEIRMFGFNFAPRGWAHCDGQLLAIASHSALFSLLGTIYGGDGRTTFALPDLRGRAPIHFGNGAGLSDRRLGARFGEEEHVLNATEMPAHSHALAASTDFPTTDVPSGASISRQEFRSFGGTPSVAMAAGSIGNAGAGLAHNNMQPVLVVNYCIALQGLFPSRS